MEGKEDHPRSLADQLRGDQTAGWPSSRRVGRSRRHGVPVVLRVDGNARPFGSSASPPFGHRVADLPEIGGDLLFLPFALVVIPLVTAADLHAGIPASLVALELVIRDGHVALAALLRRAP